MTQPPVPGSAARGAIDLTGLSDGSAPSGAPVAGGTDQIHIKATDASFPETLNRSVRVPAVLVVVSSRVPESVVYLGEVVEVATALRGRIQVVSLDIDANPGMLRALQVQSVPMTLGLLQGQVLPLFAGVAAKEQLRGVLDQVLELAVQQGVTGRLELAGPAAEETLPPLHQAAFDAIERGDLDAAAAAYDQALAADPKDHDAEIGRAQVALLQRTAGADPTAARAAAADNPDDVAAQTLVADLDLLGGHVEDAFGRLIDLVKRTSGEERAAARDHLVQLFAVVGNQDERVKRGRTALMSALF
ncbi:putative thioredoxin [Nostocoides australiense Ben110]|uniref:Putative thioredoxin n=1 Tax=Nostocoides australiense Ben110 TaxID=1193182 RepID=W6JU62_9MICO|nr:tetratricopeptide repeat protein [Tetrasphaera australiensis]CCH72422.1 putative thioredoxin [Tetrasphaera australiensis Ben110]